MYQMLLINQVVQTSERSAVCFCDVENRAIDRCRCCCYFFFCRTLSNLITFLMYAAKCCWLVAHSLAHIDFNLSLPVFSLLVFETTANGFSRPRNLIFPMDNFFSALNFHWENVKRVEKDCIWATRIQCYID